MRIEDHQRATVIRQFIQQRRVQRAVPRRRLPHLLVMSVGLVVHQDERDLVGDGARAEAEDVIVAGVHPAFTQRRVPQHQPAKHRQPRADGGLENLVLDYGVEFHVSLGTDALSQSVGQTQGENSFFARFVAGTSEIPISDVGSKKTPKLCFTSFADGATVRQPNKERTGRDPSFEESCWPKVQLMFNYIAL